jgi:formylglycine-generating enzyme required for sulfatase activity
MKTQRRFASGLAAAALVLACSTSQAQALPVVTTNTLSIQIYSKNNAILTWATNAIGFALQSATNPVSPAVWNTVSPLPVVVNGQNIVSNSAAGSRMFYRLAIPSGMALIPAGAFTMGDSLDGETDAIPTVSVTVSAFYMDVTPVTYIQWQSVYIWATNNGYGFDFPGSGKAAYHPAQTMDWYDAVIWCNARSQLAGLTPVYYTDAGFMQVYSNGEVDAVYANWSASGYRLPTEAEWEKAARGGLSGQRFPWGNTISESQANYYGVTSIYNYDLGPDGYNAAFYTGEGTEPFTSPVGSFPANGYGLYDMAGNIGEWCWDWYDYNLSSAGSPYAGGTDPRGPASSPYGARIMRGDPWADYPYYLRCAYRNYYYPGSGNYYTGFRCVKGL